MSKKNNKALDAAINAIRKEMPETWEFNHWGASRELRSEIEKRDHFLDRLSSIYDKQMRRDYAKIWGNAMTYFMEQLNVDIFINPKYRDGITADVAVYFGPDPAVDAINKHFARRYKLKANITVELENADSAEDVVEDLVARYRNFLRREFGLPKAK